MRIIFTMILAVLFSAGQVMAENATNAKDDGGFGSSRFSAQAPVALGGSIGGDVIPSNEIAVVPSISPADIEPAAGEVDITPEVEILENGHVIENSAHQSETLIIQKDLSVR